MPGSGARPAIASWCNPGRGARGGPCRVGPFTSRSAASGSIYVVSGQTYTVAATTRVSAVTIEQGGVLTAPSGYSLTLTGNGVETGQKLAATSGADTVFVPGSWQGVIVSLSVDATSAPAEPRGKQVTMTVNGTATEIRPGARYSGAIVLTPA
jgi:hypothetical protein